MLTLPERSDSLRDAARKFVYDLECSREYGSCDETPAHKVWHTLCHEDARWPTYECFVAGRSIQDVLPQRWQLPPAWLAFMNAQYEAGRPDVYTPAAWADLLGIPETAYCQLRDLVFSGHIALLWALADGDAITLPPDAATVEQRTQRLLDAARELPPAEQLYLIHRLTDSLQYQLHAMAEEGAVYGAPAWTGNPGTYGNDRRPRK